MSSGKWFLCAAMVLATSSFLSAADEPTAAPSTQPTDAKPPHAKRLVEPWSLLKTLTPDQITQIETIHSDANEEIKKITKKESDDITALLSPDQQAELKEAVAKKKLEMKEKNAMRKHAMATTAPAN